jgi:hypothetical protein
VDPPLAVALVFIGDEARSGPCGGTPQVPPPRGIPSFQENPTMHSPSRTSLIGFALMAALSAPLAFAQSATASGQVTAPTPTSAAATTVQDAADAQETTTATDTSAAPMATPAKKSWADVDTDKDGKLTKAEAGTVPALAHVFDKADGNADGALTAEEYKAYAAQVQAGDQGDDSSK